MLRDLAIDPKKRELFERLIDELRKQERRSIDGVESWRVR
jgi:hypothetical protein